LRYQHTLKRQKNDSVCSHCLGINFLGAKVAMDFT
jgi:hypothetical protein